MVLLRTYPANARVMPYRDPHLASLMSVKLPPSVSYAKGQLLGELVGNDEVQQVLINATGGSFTISYGGATTGTINYNASAATVQTALRALSSINGANVNVTKARSRWTLTGQAGTDGGTYQIRVTANGVTRTTTSLAWNDNTSTVDTALEALSNVGTGGVVATVGSADPIITTLVFAASLGDVQVEVVNDSTNDGGAWEGGWVVTETDLGGDYRVTFTKALGKTNVAALTTGAGSLTGGAGTATVSTLTAGSAGTPGVYSAYDPTATNGAQIPSCFLEYAADSDSDGKITFFSEEHGMKWDTVPAFCRGTFACSDLVGLDDNAVAILGRLVTGTVAAGILQLI